MLPTKCRSIWPSCVRVEDFQKLTNQKKELSVAAMFVNRLGQNANLYKRTFHRCFLPSFGLFGQAVSEEENFKKIRKKNCLWQPCLLTDQDEMCNLYRGPSIATSYKDSAQLAKRFQRKIFFRNRPIRSKNCMWRSCL